MNVCNTAKMTPGQVHGYPGVGSEAAGNIEHGRCFSEARSYWEGLARLLEMADRVDQRGSLVEFDFQEMPFEPRRSFVVHDVPEGVARGRHSHRRGQQLLICLAGTVVVEMRHAGEVQLVELTKPTQALLLTAGVWAEQRYSGPDALLLVMASDPYDASSYVSELP